MAVSLPVAGFFPHIWLYLLLGNPVEILFSCFNTSRLDYRLRILFSDLFFLFLESNNSLFPRPFVHSLTRRRGSLPAEGRRFFSFSRSPTLLFPPIRASDRNIFAPPVIFSLLPPGRFFTLLRALPSVPLWQAGDSFPLSRLMAPVLLLDATFFFFLHKRPPFFSKGSLPPRSFFLILSRRDKSLFARKSFSPLQVDCSS